MGSMWHQIQTKTWISLKITTKTFLQRNTVGTMTVHNFWCKLFNNQYSECFRASISQFFGYLKFNPSKVHLFLQYINCAEGEVGATPTVSQILATLWNWKLHQRNSLTHWQKVKMRDRFPPSHSIVSRIFPRHFDSKIFIFVKQ